MTLVALSASYGAGGSVIGPALAERLRVPFLDRAVPLAVADRLQVPYDEAAAHDGQAGNGGWLERMLTAFMAADPAGLAALPAETMSAEDFRRATEEVLLEQASTGTGVLLGRGSVVLLRDDPRALRVRLDGPPDRRARQALRLVPSLDIERAEEARERFDRAHAAYIRQFYDVDIRDPALYHMVIDSTSIEFEASVELIVVAVRSALVNRP